MVQVPLLDLSIALHEDVYEPAEDSLLLAEHTDVRAGERVLELGTGTGLVALVAARAGADVVATDVNPQACRLARSNARANDLRVDVVCTDLGRGLVSPFDRILCNPPYLPTSRDEVVSGVVNRALDGGPRGDRITRRVLHEFARLLAPHGAARLLVSTLQPVDELRAVAASLGITWREVARASFGMEVLVVVDLRWSTGTEPGRTPEEP